MRFVRVMMTWYVCTVLYLCTNYDTIITVRLFIVQLGMIKKMFSINYPLQFSARLAKIKRPRLIQLVKIERIVP